MNENRIIDQDSSSEKERNRRSTPVVSIIVPIYEAERFLPEAIESIAAQTFSDWEVILVDDHSLDRSFEIARKFTENDERIRLIRLEENRGVSTARNIGIENARGEFIAFLDADDCYYSDSLEILIKTAIAYPEAGIISGGFTTGYEFSPLINRNQPKLHRLSPDRAMEMVLYQNPRLDHSPWAKLYRREIFRTARFKPGIKFEDMEIFPKLLGECKEVIVIDRPVYFYRTNPGSFMNTWKPGRLDVLKITDDILENVRREHPELEKAARNLRLSANFASFIRSSLHQVPEIPDRTWNVIRHERLSGLSDPKVRLKNKLGILLTYLGRSTFLQVASRLKKYKI